MPDFLIIGAQKCGTTSLYNYLIQHPQIVSASQKEVHFFDLNFSKGIDWYEEQFPKIAAEDSLLVGEASPYYIFHPQVSGRVKQRYPQVKLIVLIRDPVARAWSHYHHEVRLGYEKLSFEEAIAAEPERLQGESEKLLADETYYSFNHQHYTYLSRGIYIDQIQKWQELFPKEQFLILKSEDLYANPDEILQQTFKFLALPPYQLTQYSKYNVGSYQHIEPSTQRYLSEYFQPHNLRIAEKLGITLSQP